MEHYKHQVWCVTKDERHFFINPLEFSWWIDQLKAKLSNDCILEEEIRKVITTNTDGTSTEFTRSFRMIVGRFISKVIKSTLTASFKIESPKDFEKNLGKLNRLRSSFPGNPDILDMFSNKREKWVSLFCSESIKQIETYLLHFSSLISSYGFSKAGKSKGLN